jgi:hypothetical protein
VLIEELLHRHPLVTVGSATLNLGEYAREVGVRLVMGTEPALGPLLTLAGGGVDLNHQAVKVVPR